MCTDGMAWALVMSVSIECEDMVIGTVKGLGIGFGVHSLAYGQEIGREILIQPEIKDNIG